MTPFPREDYRPLRVYDRSRNPGSVDLSDNTNLWGPHPRALEVIRKAGPDTLTRYPPAYAADLKEAIAAKFSLLPQTVVTGCGSNDLLDSAIRAATLPPGKISFPEPTVSMASAFARMNGLEARPVPWRKAEVDPGRLLLDDPAVVYVCRPNNPTGASATRDWVRTLLALGGPKGPLVVLDEAYADFADDTFVQEAPGTERLLVLRTFSHLYGLAGLRVGFAVGSRELVKEVEKSRGPYKVSHLAGRAAIAALVDPSGWADQIRADTVRNRDRLVRALRSRGLHPLPSQANFLLVPVEPASAMEVQRTLAEHGVACRPFPYLEDVGDALRITVGPWELMEQFLEALDALFEPSPDEKGGS